MEELSMQDLLLVIGEQTIAIRVLKQDVRDANDKMTALLSENITMRNQLEELEEAGK